MEKMFMTVLLACDAQGKLVTDTIRACGVQGVQVIAFAVKGFSTPEPLEQGKVTILPEIYDQVCDGYAHALLQVQTEYVQFCHAGDVPSEKMYVLLADELQKQNAMKQPLPAFVGIPAVYQEEQLKTDLENFTLKPVNYIENPERVPVSFSNIIFRKDLIEKKGFTEDTVFCTEIVFLWQVLADFQYGMIVSGCNMKLAGANPSDLTGFSAAQDARWYFETFQKGIIPALRKIKERKGYVDTAIQYGAFYELSLRFSHNLNTRDKHVCGDRLEEFWTLCHELLQFIDDEIIFNVGKYERYKCSNSMKIWLMKLKYGDHVQMEYMLHAGNATYLMHYKGIVFEQFDSQKILVDTINLEKTGFLMECSFMDLTPRAIYTLHAQFGEQELSIEDTSRFSKIAYFGATIHEKRTFKVLIPFELIGDETNLSFYAIVFGRKIPLKYESTRFPSRVSTELKNAYWCRGGYLLRYYGKNSQLRFFKNTKRKHLNFEWQFLKTVFSKNKKVFFFRMLYWLTYPYFVGKRIWITFDKMYKTGDNGDYFYRYARKQKDGIIVRYIANKGYPDTIRMQKEHLKPLIFSTPKQRLYFLHASLIAATHANIPVFSGTSPAKFKYVQDLLEGEVVCIQHGLAVQQLAHNLNSQYDNTKRFYCASPYEVRNLEQPAYGYYEPEKMLPLVGLARYDGLVNKDQRQILITPTWRSYISMPVSIGNTRPYAPDFKNTVYYAVFNSLIQNKKLIETARRCNYKLIYLLHPTISSQIGDFTPGEGVELRSPVGVNYEEILTTSSLMVTDYSGVQFDFAYMRKPIVYYHTPKLPPHYEEGGFFYDTMGFGEICEDEEQLVDTLCGYMEHECQMTSFYKGRADSFFAYSDHDNCARIYKEIKAFDDEQRLLRQRKA